ncbi:hypothetical protein GCM10007103_28990 [Salinimicrobium marinum]|uniref:Glycosyltransferase RgtA/B/C/D-like domain-containing protein n=1 Tax=Salinimicrobium marinum TaxID=680283 RepID=A0A918SKR6_9FLAO|nr:hypothetical protein [Salinimicrobium marinum]GHA46113.1 hypothetical protein GCM10007103_28990 [Salinimicrobium marinum]
MSTKKIQDQTNFLKVFGIAILFYLFFGVYNLKAMGLDRYIYLMNLVALLSIYSAIFVFIRSEVVKVKPLILTTFGISLVFTITNIILYKEFSTAIFEYTGSDSVFYHETAAFLSNGNIATNLDNFLRLTRFGYDDSGFLLYLAVIYKIFEEPLIVRLFNVLINSATVYFLYRIARQFLPQKLSILSALIFGISSFSIYYQSSGLKETLMLFIITLNFFSWYRMRKPGNKKYVILFLATLVSILFFRTVLVAFLACSYGASFFFKIKSNVLRVLFAIVLLAIFLGSILYLELINVERYLNATNMATTDRETHSASIFNRMAAVLAGIFGPFPSFIPLGDNRDTVMHAPSLILKVFLSPYFFYAIYIALKNKFRELYPMLLFSLCHIISLSYLVHTFKLRNQFPHLPFFILCALVGYYYLHNLETKSSKRNLIGAMHIILIPIIFFWNYLRI